MNQGKLEVVKQEMARVNVDILGISKLKWTGMCEFNSDDHYIYYVGRNSLEEMEENNRMGKSRDLFKKIRDTKGKFHAKMDTKKGQILYGPNRSRRY